MSFPIPLDFVVVCANYGVLIHKACFDRMFWFPYVRCVYFSY